jgi:subtilisin family serine protease
MHLILALTMVTTGLITTTQVPPTPDYVAGRFVVESPRTPWEGAAAASVRNSSHDTVLGHRVIETAPTGDPVEQAAALSASLGAEVTPMVMYRMLGDAVDEPLFPDQWSLRNTGQGGGTTGADIDAVPAWQWSLGAGTVVAVIDSGVDPTAADLAGSLWQNGDEVAGNGIDDDGNGFVDDRWGWDFVDAVGDPVDSVGHGTAVASVVAARSDGSGMAGVAPEASIMAVRACASFGCPADAVAEAIVYAADNGADVINISLGAPGVEPLVTAAVGHAQERGVLVVAAAGNNGNDIDATGPWTPVSIEGVLGVAWTTRDDMPAGATNYGPATVELAAPGDLILTADLDGGHSPRSGTSFAAPHVAGAAALMLALAPDLTATELAELLSETGDPLPSLVGVVSSGRRLDAARAVQAARFRDIVDSVFADDIMWAAASGIAAGCGDNLFCPDDPVTRGQMAAFLTRALDLTPSGTDRFTDDAGSVFGADIDALATAGITTGCNPPANDRYCPDDPVTRGQMAAFLTRALDLTPSGTDRFTDDTGSVFGADIDALATAGITTGCNPPANDRYCPDDPVTRGQLMAFLRRGLSTDS